MRKWFCLFLLCGLFGIAGCGGGNDVDRPDETPPMPTEGPAGMNTTPTEKPTVD